MGSVCTRSAEHGGVRWGGRAPVPVTLHIYNLGKSTNARALNQVLRKLGTGAFHVGVEVYGSEWSFSDIQPMPGEYMAVGTGIFCCEPRRCDGHSFAESVPMGQTIFSEVEVGQLMSVLKKDWPVQEYHTLRKNCCHFSNEFCERLGVGSIPDWVLNLANAGAAIADAGDAVCCTSRPTQVLWCCSTENLPRSSSGWAHRSRAAVAATGVADEAEELQEDTFSALPVLPPFERRDDATLGRKVAASNLSRSGGNGSGLSGLGGLGVPAKARAAAVEPRWVSR